MSILDRFAKILTENKTMKKVAELLEFDGINMSLPEMLFTLYGATVGVRAWNAYDKHDRREILTRDLTSVTLIVFGSRAIKKMISYFSSQKTGMALAKTEGCSKFDYLRPAGGVSVLSSPEIKDIYSGLNREKGELMKLFDFVGKNSGNVAKMLSMDETVKKASETILGETITKSTDVVKLKDAFQKAHGTGASEAVKAALDKVYEFMKNPDNAFVKKGKGINAIFDLASTVAVIFLMIGLQFFNQYQTQKKVAQLQKEKALKSVDFEKASVANLKAPELKTETTKPEADNTPVKKPSVSSRPALTISNSHLKV